MLKIGRNIPTRFERLAVAFENLAKSFMEKSFVRAVLGEEDAVVLHDKENCNIDWLCYSENKEILQEIFGCGYDALKERVRRETEIAIRIVVGDKSSSGYKRLIMSLLRERDFDLGNY
ncbi:hypothetical protein TSUD_159880 [Trifolium subterraneum]|uniref:Uncharacterized protein n=1 Tax=Trifolium subterraneum TaxID=3900 RepID=A0A2Z6M666_TRISU|nr:hypothetical protein TSUD_159880 [Trifolium subterraneum]